MSEVRFFNALREPLELPKTDAVKNVVAAADKWADDNALELAFALEGDDHLHIHLGGVRLNNWVDLKCIADGDVHTLLEQLDYARFEYRRSAAGYGKFDM